MRWPPIPAMQSAIEISINVMAAGGGNPLANARPWPQNVIALWTVELHNSPHRK